MARDQAGALLLGAKCRPFVVESYGAWGVQAQALVKELLDEAQEQHGAEAISRTRLHHQILGSVSAAVQRGNADMLLQGNQWALRVARRGSDIVVFPQLRDE